MKLVTPHPYTHPDSRRFDLDAVNMKQSLKISYGVRRLSNLMQITRGWCLLAANSSEKTKIKSLKDPSFPLCLWRWAIGSLGYIFYHGCRCSLVILGVQIQNGSPGHCPSNWWPIKYSVTESFNKRTHWTPLLPITESLTNSKRCHWTNWASLEPHNRISSPRCSPFQPY